MRYDKALHEVHVYAHAFLLRGLCVITVSGFKLNDPLLFSQLLAHSPGKELVQGKKKSVVLVVLGKKREDFCVKAPAEGDSCKPDA